MVLNKGIWEPKPRVTNIKGTNLKSLIYTITSTITGTILLALLSLPLLLL